ncbi:MAG TPA: PDZ domain-containing protein [Candidatus Tripitaka sp. YC43]
MKLSANLAVFLLVSLVHLLSYHISTSAAPPSFELKLTDLESPFGGLKLVDSQEPPGVKIVEVDRKSGASKVLKSGDIIVEIEGQAINSLGDFMEAFSMPPGKECVSASIKRGDKTLGITLMAQMRDKASIAQAFVKKYKIREVVGPEVLSSDTSVFGGVFGRKMRRKGKAVAICLEVVRATAEDKGLFRCSAFLLDRPVIVSGLPGFAFQEGEVVTLAARLIGQTELSETYISTLGKEFNTAPNLEFLGYERGDLTQEIAEALQKEKGSWLEFLKRKKSRFFNREGK